MRKKMFGKLLTVSLSENLYEQVRLISEKYEVSMGEVLRSAIECSLKYGGGGLESKGKPFQDKNSSVDFSSCQESQEKEATKSNELQ